MKRFIFHVVCVLSIMGCAVKQDPSIRDLDFIYSSILENHPGVYNEEDPCFLERLERVYAIAKSKMEGAQESSDTKKAITDFVRSFGDTHLWIHWVEKTPRQQGKEIKAAQGGRTIAFSVSKLTDDVAWITLPTFEITVEEEEDFRELIQSIQGLQTKEHLIFDLRGNQGGNSDYGSQVV